MIDFPRAACPELAVVLQRELLAANMAATIGTPVYLLDSSIIKIQNFLLLGKGYRLGLPYGGDIFLSVKGGNGNASAGSGSEKGPIVYIRTRIQK